MKKVIYPRNREHFKKLLQFAKEIILICQKNNISPVIYGSFAHFYYTKDEKMKVNDIDILINKKYFPKMMQLLKKNKIKFKHFTDYDSDLNIIKDGKLKVEVDEVGTGYKTLTDKSLTNNVNTINFYGIKVKMITLKQLEDIYPVAYNRSKDDKAKILKKIKHLEKFLGRKLK
jgi:hypothetical protein